MSGIERKPTSKDDVHGRIGGTHSLRRRAYFDFGQESPFIQPQSIASSCLTRG